MKKKKENNVRLALLPVDISKHIQQNVSREISQIRCREHDWEEKNIYISWKKEQ